MKQANIRLERGDTLIFRSPRGDELDIILSTIRPDGKPSVWYAINPTLRHWLGWLELQDSEDTGAPNQGAQTYALRMDPFHVEYLEELKTAANRS